VDIAVKALSPGINDPTTAVNCIDHLGSLLRRLNGRAVPTPYRTDPKGQLRLIVSGPTFAGMVDLAFNEIRQFASASAPVLLRMLETLAIIGRANDDPRRRDVLWRVVCQVQELADAQVEDPQDRSDFNERLQTAAAALGRTPRPLTLAPRAPAN
jgi:uncharacterized membrane protein